MTSLPVLQTTIAFCTVSRIIGFHGLSFFSSSTGRGSYPSLRLISSYKRRRSLSRNCFPDSGINFFSSAISSSFFAYRRSNSEWGIWSTFHYTHSASRPSSRAPEKITYLDVVDDEWVPIFEYELKPSPDRITPHDDVFSLRWVEGFRFQLPDGDQVQCVV